MAGCDFAGLVRKEVEIIMEKKLVSQALFRSVGQDGANWLVVVKGDDGWAITCNGKEVGRGSGKQTSIDAGVQKFLSLTRVIVGSDAACDPVVGDLLDRIERGRSTTAKVAKYEGTIGPHESKESPAHLTVYGTAKP